MIVYPSKISFYRGVVSTWRMTNLYSQEKKDEILEPSRNII